MLSGGVQVRYDKEDKNDNLRFMGWMVFVVSSVAVIADYFETGFGFGSLWFLGAIMFAVGCVMIWKFRNPNGETLWEKIKAY